MANEIVPVTALHSNTLNNDQTHYNVYRALDLELGSCSYTDVGLEVKAWWKANLDREKVHCVYQIIEYQSNGYVFRTYTCSGNGCVCTAGTCDGAIVVTVGFEEEPTDLSTLTECINGDYVKLESTASFALYELAITKRPGKRSKTLFITLILLSSYDNRKSCDPLVSNLILTFNNFRI